MSQGHGHPDLGDASPRARRMVVALVTPFVLATVVGLVVLWPDRAADPPPSTRRVDGTVTAVRACDPATSGIPTTGEADATGGTTGTLPCLEADVRLTEGTDAGQVVTVPAPPGAGAPTVAVGDPVVLVGGGTGSGPPVYDFSDFQRGTPMLVLAMLFAAAIITLSRWRGLAALVGLLLSVAVLVFFVLPALLDGSPPLLVAVVAASAIMIVALYLAHGVNLTTSVALLGTLGALVVTGLLGVAFTQTGRFTGLGEESAAYLSAFALQVDPRGLLLAGIVIGALGVLDDVTVTQASAVRELAATDPSLTFRPLWTRAMRIGRDHVSSTVNTLALAYAGAALPLLLLFQFGGARAGDVLTVEVVAAEVVRALVGSLGIVAAVPLTTGLAAWVASSGR